MTSVVGADGSADSQEVRHIDKAGLLTGQSFASSVFIMEVGLSDVLNVVWYRLQEHCLFDFLPPLFVNRIPASELLPAFRKSFVCALCIVPISWVWLIIATQLLSNKSGVRLLLPLLVLWPLAPVFQLYTRGGGADRRTVTCFRTGSACVPRRCSQPPSHRVEGRPTRITGPQPQKH